MNVIEIFASIDGKVVGKALLTTFYAFMIAIFAVPIATRLIATGIDSVFTDDCS